MAMLQRGHQVLLTMARQCAVRHFRSAPILLKAGRTQNEFTGEKKLDGFLPNVGFVILNHFILKSDKVHISS